MNAGQKFRGESAPAMVPPFGPGIGKQEVKRRNRVIGQQVRYHVGDLDSEHARIFQIFAGNLPTNLAYSTEQAFDPEKIVLRMRVRHSHEKGAVAASKVDFDRGAMREYFAPI